MKYLVRYNFLKCFQMFGRQVSTLWFYNCHISSQNLAVLHHINKASFSQESLSARKLNNVPSFVV